MGQLRVLGLLYPAKNLSTFYDISIFAHVEILFIINRIFKGNISKILIATKTADRADISAGQFERILKLTFVYCGFGNWGDVVNIWDGVSGAVFW